MPSDVGPEQPVQSMFDQRAPFFELYELGFPSALLEGDRPFLNVHREAVYYLREGCVLRVVERLLELAAQVPTDDYVESLCLYLQMNRENFIRLCLVSDESRRARVAGHLRELALALETHDSDLAGPLREIEGALARHVSPT